MKIKSIRQFRTFYKKEIREQESGNRNEHYVGVRTDVNGKSQYGFFEIYHGDKEGFNESDGIRGFLEGFLDMAKDGQAVYEFMQNAVDAGSTHFGLFWGKDEVDEHTYLLVINNGEMFTMDSVRSILNVGVSTKSGENYQIGKFGIGFKLAHRLVGKENGLDELIYENYGPILFSWSNNEIDQLPNLIKHPDVTPAQQDYEVFSHDGKRKAICKTNDPWLFKILITNFPCQPENDVEPELIYDSRYHETTYAFSKMELEALGRWMQKNAHYLNGQFTKGSLFFIRLGQGKQSHLEEENLEEGVKFSLAILNKIAKQSLGHDGLRMVNLRGRELEPVPLEFEAFNIRKTENTAEYRTIRFGKTEELTDVEQAKELGDQDIEILLGFTDYKQAQAIFHNAPNFYLFFPLSEEKHNLRFILHSNAFYKSSSRTYLQKGSVGEEGINERLFKVFATKLKERMLAWAESAEKDKKGRFLALYANLLLSDASENPERVWVNEPLWVPIRKFLENHIPVKNVADQTFTLAHDPARVRIKDTSLPVDSENWLKVKVEWFAWDAEDLEIRREAERKLKIRPFTLIDLLQTDGIAGPINQWLETEAFAPAGAILKELNGLFSVTQKPTDIFWTNLGQIKIWEFEDGFFSLEEIGEEANYSIRLIRFDTLDQIRNQLKKGKWHLSIPSLADFSNLFPQIQARYQSVIKYIRNNDELIAVLNLKLPDADLSKSEKLGVVEVLAKKLQNDKEDRINRLRSLRLFQNRAGQAVPLKALVKDTQIRWLSPFVIRSTEEDEGIQEYLTSTPVDIYQHIIVPYWSELVSRLSSQSDMLSLYDYAKGVYKQSNKLPTLSDKEIIKIGKTFVNQEVAFYYAPMLVDWEELQYAALAAVLQQLSAAPLPAFELLTYYGEPPFKLAPTSFRFSIDQPLSISLELARAFLKLALREVPDLIKKVTLYQTAQREIILSPKLEKVDPVVSDSPLINIYIADYHAEALVIFPQGLEEFHSSIPLHGAALVRRLAHDCDLGNEKQLAALIEIALQSDVVVREYLADRISHIAFHLDDRLDPEGVAVRLVRLILSSNDENKARAIIKAKTTIVFETEVVQLAQVHLLGNDEVLFEKGDDKFALSLSMLLINIHSKATRTVGLLTEALAAIGVAEKVVLDRLFGLSGRVDKGFIANQLKERYDGAALENAHQLAFVLHYAEAKPKEFSLEPFRVQLGGLPQSMKDVVWYTPENAGSFVPDDMVLDERYVGVFSLVTKNTTIYRAPSNVTLCQAVYIENGRLYLPGVQRIETDERKERFLAVAFGLWKKGGESLSNLSLQADRKWMDIFGFNPTMTITGSEWLMETEKLPSFMIDWLNKPEDERKPKEKYDFLRAIGVSLAGSDIVRVRQYLLGDEGREPDFNYTLPSVLIVNTLSLLVDRKRTIGLNSEKERFLRDVYQRLPEDLAWAAIPLPVISPDHPDSLEIACVESGLLIEADSLAHLQAVGYTVQALQQEAGMPVVLVDLLKYPKKLPNTLSPAIFTFTDLNSDRVRAVGREWRRDFYIEWKIQFPQYQIVLYPGLLPRVVKLNGKSIFDYPNGEIAVEGGMIAVNEEKNEKAIIHLIESVNGLPAGAHSQLNELFNKYEDSIRDFLNRVQANDKLRAEMEKLQQKDREEQKRKELSEEFGRSERYSMAWFMNLLELMVMNGAGKELANPEGDLTFNKVMYDPADLRVIALGDPSKTISPAIELFTDFKATFHYHDKSEIGRKKEILIKGVTKKGQEVLAIPADPQELASINLDGIQYVELRFVRIIDLISKLTRAFRQLPFEPAYNLKKELTDKLQFVFGPPGTGKTTYLARLILDKIRTGTSRNILVLTPTNKAADVLATRILEEGSENDYMDGWLVRYGASADVTLLDSGLVYDGNTLKFHLYQRSVVITTVHRFPYEKIITDENQLGEEKTPLNEITWDTIVFDEASMIMLPAIVYPLFKRKFKRAGDQELTEFIVGGDPFQIPPIFDLPDEELPETQRDVKEENIYTVG